MACGAYVLEGLIDEETAEAQRGSLMSIWMFKSPNSTVQVRIPSS